MLKIKFWLYFANISSKQCYVRFDERNNQRGTVYKEDSNKWFPATEKGSLIIKYADEAHSEHYLRYYSIL